LLIGNKAKYDTKVLSEIQYNLLANNLGRVIGYIKTKSELEKSQTYKGCYPLF